MGRLSLDDTVESRVPGFEMLSPFAPTNRGITFRQLGCHLAGLPREPPCMQFVAGDDPHHFNCQNVTTAEILARLSGVAQKLRTDVLPQYSNLGFSLLGHAADMQNTVMLQEGKAGLLKLKKETPKLFTNPVVLALLYSMMDGAPMALRVRRFLQRLFERVPVADLAHALRES